jgi:hypothetical protein
MLLDTSGTYAFELKKAQLILNYLLGTLQPMDTLAVARINTGSFSEKDIIAKVTFYQRPSVANNQKRAFQIKIDKFISKVKNSKYTDISGGLYQAIEYLNKADPGKKYVRDVPFQLSGFNVIALNDSKLKADIHDPKEYMNRVEQWRNKIESSNGQWRVVNDLERLDNIFSK